MITEDYVSFEVAKLLKEKEFDGECDLFGRTDESELIIREASKIAYKQGIDEQCVILPTLQMAMKWLREKGFIISPIPDFRFGKLLYTNIIVNMNREPLRLASELYDTYEEACEGGIKYCLENLN